MSQALPKVQKSDLVRFIEGHRLADEVIRKEKKERSKHLSPEESLAEYEALCQTWEASRREGDWEGLDLRKVSFLVQRRKLLDRLGGQGGNA